MSWARRTLPVFGTSPVAAGRSAKDVGARGYAGGPHVVFAPGEYRPDHVWDRTDVIDQRP